jgi:hypothetical protein
MMIIAASAVLQTIYNGKDDRTMLICRLELIPLRKYLRS